MISKSVKTKRRQQAAESVLILNALQAAVPAEAGEYQGVWPSCHTLNEIEGMGRLPRIAQEVARYPRGSNARLWAALCAGNSEVVSALGHYTPEIVLRRAGLL